MAAKKTDKDMGREVNKLGGFKPDTNRLPAGPNMRNACIIERRIEILMIARPRTPRLLDEPVITFHPYP